MGTAYHLDQALVHSRNRGRCTKMHAHMTGPGVDGCQLFDGANRNDMFCGACGCHMNYHVKISLSGSRYGFENEVIDLEPGAKRCKMSVEASPAESVGDNLDSPGLEVNSVASQDDFARVWGLASLLPMSPSPERDDNKNNRVSDRGVLCTETLLYSRLCSKLKLIQAEYPVETHGKFSIVHDDVHGYRVYCGGCDRRYGIPKPGYSLGNFERGHLASKRHKDVGAPLGRMKIQKMTDFLHKAEAKKASKAVHCG